MNKNTSSIRVLLRLLDEAYERKAWHGPNLRGALRAVTASQASWRPARNRHSIWELTLHCAYWKYAVRRRLLGQKRGSFPIKGSNWFAGSNTPIEKAWRADLRLLETEHRALRKAVLGLGSRRLGQKPGGRSASVQDLLIGIAAHDLYHAGQIQLLKRLQKSASRHGRHR